MSLRYVFYIKVILVVQMLILCMDPLQGQDDSWETELLTTQSGLSNRFINSIVQDHRGYTWISTNFGLNRYDGQHIEVLTRESHQLQANTIYELLPDANNNIWVTYRDVSHSPIHSIDILDPVSFKLVSLEEYILPSREINSDDIITITSDLSSNIYILTSANSVFRYDRTGLHHLFDLEPGRPIQYLKANTKAIYSQYIGSDTIMIHHTDGKWIRNVPYPPTPGKYHGMNVLLQPIGEIAPGKECMILSYDYQRKYSVILDTNGFSNIHPFAVPGDSIGLFGYDPYERKILGSNSRETYLFDPVTGKSKFTPAVLPECRAFYADPQGHKWIGVSNGLLILRKKSQYFNSFLRHGMPYPYSCRGFVEDKNGKIYILTYNGNMVFDPLTSELVPWEARDFFAGITTVLDHTGMIWIGGEYGQLIRYGPIDHTSHHWKIPVKSGDYYATWSIAQINKGDIWLGTTEGLMIKNPHDNLPPVLFNKLNGYDELNTSLIYHINETADGIWLATDHGLFLVNSEKGVLEHINEQSSQLPNNNLLFVHQDKDGIFWMASRGGGLIRWDRAKGEFRSFTMKEGLSHNVIYAVYEDDYGFLWLPSDHGLMRFEKNTGTVRTFLENEGIPHEEFNRASHFKDRSGNFYFGTLDGFIRFNPKNLLEVNSASLPVQLTKFEVINEKSGEVKDLTYPAVMQQEIKVGSNVTSFLIHYSILDYEDPKLKRFAYYIEGLNPTWTYLTENFIRINGMKGGSYTIHIKGLSSTGRWSENELLIPLTIRKPFLARWYALAMLILLMVGLFIIIYRKRVALQKAKLRQEMAISNQLRQVDKLKDQFLANTSHELRTPLNGIVGLSESLLSKNLSKEDKTDLELIISSGRRLSNLVNDILDFSRLKEHDLQLQLKPLDIRSVVDLCIRMNRHMIQGKELEMKISIPSGISYCYADENRLQQILQNLIANAIKFTEKGTIEVSAHESGNIMVISVADTGIGIDKEKHAGIFKEFEQADGSISREFGGTGLGLSITKSLVELHGGTINVESTPGKGSVFSFSIPVWNGEISGIEEKSGNTVGAATNGTRAILGPDVEGTEPATPAAKGKGNEQKHILIVDDEFINLKVLRNHLQQEGYLVTQATDGEQALELIEKNNNFDLVLLDVMMPRITGYEVCQRIREKYLPAELPVIMVTAKNQVNDLVEGLALGANDYIVKPFSKDELLARVKTQLENHDIHVATNRFVPHEFIHTLGRQNIMDLHRGDMVEQNVHVMFSDIRDYTTLAEDMTPVENFKFVNKLAGKVGPIVKRNHGMVNQYLGDTIMMLFMEKASDGLQAGIDILQMIAAYNLQREKKGQKIIRLGIGLHSGPLIMGIIGDSMRTDAAVISDTVNTASRMEGLTKFYNVNLVLSADTVSKLEDPERFSLRYLGKVKAKGKMQPTGVYECFDADAPEVKKIKAQTLELFHKAQESYFAKDLDAALAYFSSVYQANPSDRTVLGFLNRVHAHLGNGIGDDWTGVELMEAK